MDVPERVELADSRLPAPPFLLMVPLLPDEPGRLLPDVG